MGHYRPLFGLFHSFHTNITIFKTMFCEKGPSNIQCSDSNPRPLEYPPITTRLGLPPNLSILCIMGLSRPLFLYFCLFNSKQKYVHYKILPTTESKRPHESFLHRRSQFALLGRKFRVICSPWLG